MCRSWREPYTITRRSLDLRNDQYDVILEVGKLYCTLKEDVPHRDIKDWLCKIERIDPTHPLVFQLKERLLSTTNTIEYCNGLKTIISQQLTLGIDDEVLHIKLATLYDKLGSLVDAVLYCQSVNESSTVMLCNMKWQLFCLNLYQHYCDSGVEDVQVHISMLQCMDVLLNHMMETKESELNIIDLLMRFDTLLRQIVQSDRLVGSDVFHLLIELSGTLYCHCGKYLLSHHTELSVGLACVIAGLSVMVPDIDQSVVSPHVKDYWKQATYRRISQCGHIIKFVENNYGYNLTSTSEVTTVQVVKGVFKGRPWDPRKSFIIFDDKFSNLQLYIPNRVELQICDVEVIRNDPFHLSFLLWIALCEEETNFIVWYVQQLFSQLKTNANKLSSRCDVDTLCLFDMEAFLVLLLDKLQGEMLKGKDGMKLMIASFSGAIPIEPKHISFWKNVLNLVYGKLSACNSIIVKEQVQKVIAEIRGFKPLRLSLNQLGALARHFKKRAEEVLEYGDGDNVRILVEVLFVNSCHYWKLIIDVLKGRVHSVYSPLKQLAQRSKPSVEKSDRSSNADNDCLLDEAHLALGTAALYCKDTNSALHHYGIVNSAHGVYKQCKVYRMMAEKCCVEDPCNSHALLEKASQCVEQAIQRIPHDDDGGLLGQLIDQHGEIETAMDNLKGMEDFEFYDEFMKSDEEPQQFSMPDAAAGKKEDLSSTAQQKQPANDQSAIISVLQKQIMELQSQVAMLQEKSFTDTTYTPATAKHISTSSMTTSSSNTSYIFSDLPSSHISPLASSVSQYSTSYSIFTSSSDTTYTSSQGVVSSSFGITPPSFYMNFQQFGVTSTTAPSSTLSFNLFSQYSPTTTTSVTQSNGHAMSSSLSIPPLSQAFTTASSIVPAIPSYNILGSNMSSASATTGITDSSSPYSYSSSLLSQGFNIANSTTTISMPLFTISVSSNTSTTTTSSSTSLFQTQLFSSSGNSSLVGQGFSIANSSVSMLSSNLLSNMSSSLVPTSSFNLFNSTASTAASTGLLQTPSSSLSYQINVFTSLGQSSSTTNTPPVFTSLSGMFQQFPTHTTSSGVFSTSAWPTTSSSENVTVSDSQPTDVDQPDMFNESQAADDGYTPLVKLTDSYEVKSGEEDEEELFSSKGKLYRYDQPTKSWKERGIGIIKILQHNSTGKIRVLMRRDQILKICCNHYITGDMELTPLANSNTSWTWMTLSDFSDEEAKVEKLCIRFKLLETAQSFQSVFTECIEKIKNIGEGVVTTNKEFSTKFVPKSGSWECGTCLIQNEEQASQCVACGSANPNVATSSTIAVSSSNVNDQPYMLNKSQVADDGYTPLVKLTDSYEVKSGEEDEEELFSSKGKLYRYDQPTKSWKERGIGIIKILQHNSTGKIRVLMRRDQILKICCSHYITGDMELIPLANSDTSWTWMTLSDFSDEQAKVEKLCIRFKLLETAQSFQSVFTECVEKIKNIGEGVITTNKESDEFSSKFAPKCGSWECGTCLIQNEEQASQCVACGSANPNMATSSTITVSSSNVTSSFGSQGSVVVLSSSGGFKLPVGLPSLNQSITQLLADTVKPSRFKLSGTLLSSLSQPTSLPKADSALPSGFKLSGTGLSLNQPTSLPSVNTSTTLTTIDVTESEHSSCEEEDEGSSEVSLETVEVSVSSEAADSSVTGTNSATRFAPKVGNWECSDCFISNEKDVAQCVACGNSNPNIKVATVSTTSTASTFAMPSLSGVYLPLVPPIVSTANPTGGFQPTSLPSVNTSTTLTTTDVTESEHSSCEEEYEGSSKVSLENVEVSVSSEVADSSVTGTDFATRFAPKISSWECSDCFVSNEKDVAQCVACGKANPNIKVVTASMTSTASTFAMPSRSGVYIPPVPPIVSTANPTGGFKLGGFKLGGLNITAFPGSLPTQDTAHSDSGEDCVATRELMPSEDDIALAQQYMLPPTFYNYKTKPPCPGCRGCEDDEADNVPYTSTTEMLPLESFGTTTTTATPVLFGASSAGLSSFASLAQNTGFQFGLQKENKGFPGAGAMLFQSQKEEHDGGDVNSESEADIDFKPLVSLPDTYQVKTDQESEEQLFCERAKLFRFDPNVKQWKERGIGNMTVMKDGKSGRVHLIMRRDQVLKICCNHVLLPDTQLSPMGGAGNAWMWFTPCDFSDEEPKAEQLAVQFKKVEQAENFHLLISKCIQETETTGK
ncbi:E3 SUMO-protein ligase RanBP2-like isoform X2 [Dysidea avara]|uniref:E3 SUMO-protein ligase RanBP2-like isoform X2 n=1 Tax=Dysidea avara TaxID=196820 RepID=UPI00331CD2EF